MAYFEQGSASDINDLLGKLRVALAANGYSVVSNAGSGTSGGMRCHMSKGNLHVNFRTGFANEVPVAVAGERTTRWGTWVWPFSYHNGAWQTQSINWLAFNLSTSHNLGASWHNQPGAPGASGGKGCASMITCLSSISRYWLFILEDPDAVFLVAETDPNKVQHIAWGNLNTCQNLENPVEWYFGSRRMYKAHGDSLGEFCYSHSFPGYANDNAMFRLNDSRWDYADGLDGWGASLINSGVPNAYGSGNYWANLGLPVPDSEIYYPENYGFDNVTLRGYIESQGRSILHPIDCFKLAEGGGAHLIGTIPHVGRTSMKPYIIGDQVAGVGETYLAFPNHQRISPFSVANNVVENISSAHVDEVGNFFGTGIAIRRP